MSMRFVRVPFIYLPDGHVLALHLSAKRMLNIIYDVRNQIANDSWDHPAVRPNLDAFLYYPNFLRWTYYKAADELAKRGINRSRELPDHLKEMQSKSLSDFIPPKDAELAADVVWLLQKWKHELRPGGLPLPLSYVELAEQYYGYHPEEAAIKRVAELPGAHRDADGGWYFIEDEP